MKETVRLDAQQAPQRQLDRRKQQVADALASEEKARAINMAAFRP